MANGDNDSLVTNKRRRAVVSDFKYDLQLFPMFVGDDKARRLGSHVVNHHFGLGENRLRNTATI